MAQQNSIVRAVTESLRYVPCDHCWTNELVDRQRTAHILNEIVEETSDEAEFRHAAGRLRMWGSHVAAVKNFTEAFCD